MRVTQEPERHAERRLSDFELEALAHIDFALELLPAAAFLCVGIIVMRLIV